MLTLAFTIEYGSQGLISTKVREGLVLKVTTAPEQTSSHVAFHENIILVLTIIHTSSVLGLIIFFFLVTVLLHCVYSNQNIMLEGWCNKCSPGQEL